MEVALQQKIHGHIIFGSLSPSIIHLCIFEVMQSDTSKSAMYFIFKSWKCRLSIWVRSELCRFKKNIFKPFFLLQDVLFFPLLWQSRKQRKLFSNLPLWLIMEQKYSLICKRKKLQKVCVFGWQWKMSLLIIILKR